MKSRPAIKPYLEFMFMDDHTLAQIAPSGDFGNTLHHQLRQPVDVARRSLRSHLRQSRQPDQRLPRQFPARAGAPYNPNPGAPPIDFFDSARQHLQPGLLPAASAQHRRRSAHRRPDAHQLIAACSASSGDLANVWSYDAYYQYGRTNYTQVYKNEFSIARLNRALNVVNVDANGVVVPVGTAGSSIVCRSVLDDSDPTCVPYDPFGTAPSQAAVNYLNVFGVIQGNTSEQIANVNFTGALGEMGIKTPWAERRRRR